MKKFLLVCLALCGALTAAETTHTAALVSAEQLKTWCDQKEAMTIVDARSKEYFDGNLLPGAQWLPSDATEADILAALPSKEGLVVVNCLNEKCPASGWLAEKLTAMGYTKVYEYREGIEDWMQRGYPTEKR